MNNQIDLRRLALNREPLAEAKPARHRRRWFSRYVLPCGVLLGFAVLLGAAAGRRLLPVRRVTTVPVIVNRGEHQQANTPLFQAPGWIEPRPTAVNVPALAAGVIENLLVVEGQHVAQGETIASLITIDAELAVERAQAALAIREGELKLRHAERDAARIRLANPLHLEVQLADAENSLAVARTGLGKLPFLIDSAEAQLIFARRSAEGKKSAGTAVSGIVLEEAEAYHADARASLEELRDREPHLRREVAALERKVDALRGQLELLIEENRQLHEAEAQVETAAALCDEAKLRLRQSELDLSRMTITSPIDGRVLRLVASPGDRVMGMDTTAEHRSSTVIQMYDPQKLQVRADVRLEDVRLVSPGQMVTIETASWPEVIQGRVLLPTSAANIQKNTLEVKVEVVDPPATLTPEMLVTATFLAPQTANPSSDSTPRRRLYIPSELVETDSTGSIVWIVDANDLAQQRSVEVGSALQDGLVEIKSGLNLTDKLIANGSNDLEPAEPVTITGDDPRLGI